MISGGKFWKIRLFYKTGKKNNGAKLDGRYQRYVMEPVAPPWPPDRRWLGWPLGPHHHEIVTPVGNWAAPAAPNMTVEWENQGHHPYPNHGVLVAPSVVNFGRQELLLINLEVH